MAILVVDNGSSAAERNSLIKCLAANDCAIVEEGAPYQNRHDLSQSKLILYLLKHNYGYATGNNYALKYCRDLGYKYAVIINNDVVVNSANSDAIIRLFSSDERIALIGVDVIQRSKHINPICIIDSALFLCLSNLLYPLFYPVIRFLQTSTRRRANKRSVAGVYSLRKNECLSGCFCACNIRALSEVDYFDSRTFLYGEEIILKAKMDAKNYKCLYLSNISVEHRHAETTKLVHWRELDRHLSESHEYYLKEYRGFGAFRLLAVNVGDNVRRFLWRPVTIALSRLIKR